MRWKTPHGLRRGSSRSKTGSQSANKPKLRTEIATVSDRIGNKLTNDAFLPVKQWRMR